jgi:hypothetical protein
MLLARGYHLAAARAPWGARIFVVTPPPARHFAAAAASSSAAIPQIPEKPDYYKILGVRRDATPEQIKAAFREQGA